MRVINQLVNDEDVRQELWISYLSGCPIDNLPSSVLEIYFNNILESNSDKLSPLVKNSLIMSKIDSMCESERAIVGLILIGFNVDTIAKYKHFDKAKVLSLIHFLTKRVNNGA